MRSVFDRTGEVTSVLSDASTPLTSAISSFAATTLETVTNSPWKSAATGLFAVTLATVTARRCLAASNFCSDVNAGVQTALDIENSRKDMEASLATTVEEDRWYIDTTPDEWFIDRRSSLEEISRWKPSSRRDATVLGYIHALGLEERESTSGGSFSSALPARTLAAMDSAKANINLYEAIKVGVRRPGG